MKAFLLALSILASVPAMALDAFENSVPVDMPSGDIASAITNIKINGSQCTGFFVANAQSRFFIATARHCARYAFTEACAAGKVEVSLQHGGYRGTCTQVIAADTEHDAVIFEATFAQPGAAYHALSYLTLSAEVVAPSSTYLTLWGYPMDRVRNGRATLSSNCWPNNGTSSNAYYSQHPDPTLEARLAARTPTQVAADEEMAQMTAAVRSHENMIPYNCTVYGGNSGGPVVKAGTRLVVGMPATYNPGRFEVLQNGYSAYFFSLDKFIYANQAALQAAGIYWGL